MLIALLIALSVDLAVVVVAAFVFGRRRWPSGMKRLGDKPVVMGFAADGGKIEIAARTGHRPLGARAADDGCDLVPCFSWRLQRHQAR